MARRGARVTALQNARLLPRSEPMATPPTIGVARNCHNADGHGAKSRKVLRPVAVTIPASRPTWAYERDRASIAMTI